jgi:hypothetical protein
MMVRIGKPMHSNILWDSNSLLLGIDAVDELISPQL